MKPPVFNPHWPEDVKAVYRHDMQEMWDPAIAKHTWNQYHNQLDLYLAVADPNRRLTVLDVGCAQGTLALLLAEQGHDVWAMDIRQQFLDYAASRYEHGNVRFICGNVLEAKVEEKFDLIFANQIIEHLVYPLEFTKRLIACLRPNGRLVMTTPNAKYLKNSLPTFSELGDPGQYAHRQFTADGDGHFFAYLDTELIAIFKEAGFHHIRTAHFETPFISGHMRLRHIHSVAPTALLRRLDRIALSIPGLNVRLAHQLMIVGSI